MVKESFEKSRGDGKDKSPSSSSQSESLKRLRLLRILHFVQEQSPSCQTKYDKPIEKQIILSDQYGKDNPGLPGGGDRFDGPFDYAATHLTNKLFHFLSPAQYEAVRNMLPQNDSAPNHDAGPSCSHGHAPDIPNYHHSHSPAYPHHYDVAPTFDYAAHLTNKLFHFPSPAQYEAVRNRHLLNNSTPNHDAGPGCSHGYAPDIPDYHPAYSTASSDYDDVAPQPDYAAHPTEDSTEDEAVRNRRLLNNSTPDHDAGPGCSHGHAPREKKYRHIEKVYINKKSEDGSINGKDKIRINVESMIVHKKGIIKEIASATTGYHKTNEDSCFISKYGGGVFDGVSEGGRGSEASRMAKEIFKQKLPKLFGTVKRDGLSREQIKAKLKQITLETNNEINKKLNENAEISARTTLSVVMPIGDGKMMAVNVGDSRVYVLTKDGKLKHITTDDGPFGEPKYWNQYQKRYGFSGLEVNKKEQKKIQEKVASMNDDEVRKIIGKNGEYSTREIKIKYAIRVRNLLSQAIGCNSVKPNIIIFDVNYGDMVIITSDGIHDNLLDKEIIECVSTSETAEDAARALVKASRENSLDQTRLRCKPDDTTAVVIECSGKGRNNV